MDIRNSLIGMKEKQDLLFKQNNYYKQFKKDKIDQNAEIHVYENENKKGWVIIEYSEEKGIKKYKITDYGNENRSTEWKLLPTEPI